MRFIGDLSHADAALLEEYARGATRILEFGSGGSTQVFAQAAPQGARIVSVDTEQEWIDKTRAHLANIPGASAVEFWVYDGWREAAGAERFDLVFVDGFSPLRGEFAAAAWGYLEVGGHLLVHDTRWPIYARVVLEVVADRFLEVERLEPNERGSNISVVARGRREPFEDWHSMEGKELWQYGAGEPPTSAAAPFTPLAGADPYLFDDQAAGRGSNDLDRIDHTRAGELMGSPSSTRRGIGGLVAFAKRVVRKLTRWYVEPAVEATLARISDLQRDVHAGHVSRITNQNRLEARVTALEAQRRDA